MAGGIKTKNKWSNTVNWDCIILYEYHWGAWNDRTKAYISEEDKIIFDEEKVVEKEKNVLINELNNLMKNFETRKNSLDKKLSNIQKEKEMYDKAINLISSLKSI